MAAIRGKDTIPEIAVRSLLHRLGYRFRLHRKDLPGRPDLVLPRHRACIFVHGCFWHRHDCPNGRATPKTRPDFWRKKFSRNVERDLENVAALNHANWRTLIIWECQCTDVETVKSSIRTFLESAVPPTTLFPKRAPPETQLGNNAPTDPSYTSDCQAGVGIEEGTAEMQDPLLTPGPGGGWVIKAGV